MGLSARIKSLNLGKRIEGIVGRRLKALMKGRPRKEK